MICSLYDEELNRIAIIGTMVSLVWSEGYTDAGVSQMVLVKATDYTEKIRCGRYIGIDSSDTLQVITQVTDKNGQLWVYMRECKYILNDRIYIGTFKCKNAEESLKTAVMDSDPYDIVERAADRGLSAVIRTERTYTSLYDISCAVCEAVGYGFRLIHNRAEKRLQYDVYEGNDRTAFKFSEKFGNLRNAVFKMSELDYKNVAYVGGAELESGRAYVTVGDVDATGTERREMFVDARDIQPEDGEDDEAYLERLIARGTDKLAEQKKVENITFELNPASYGKSFLLGDQITAIFPEYNLTVVVRISEIQRKFEKNLESLTITLGDSVIRRSH